MPAWTEFETAIICELRSNTRYKMTNREIGLYLGRKDIATQVHYTRDIKPARKNSRSSWSEPRLPRNWRFEDAPTFADWQARHPAAEAGEYPCATDESDEAAYMRELKCAGASPQLTSSASRCEAARARLNAKKRGARVASLPAMLVEQDDEPAPQQIILHELASTELAQLPSESFSYATAQSLSLLSEDQINALTAQQVRQIPDSELMQITQYTLLWRLIHDLSTSVRRKVAYRAKSAFNAIPQPNYNPTVFDPITSAKTQEVFLNKQPAVFFRVPIHGDGSNPNSLALDQEVVDDFLNQVYPRIVPGRPRGEKQTDKVWNVYGRHVDSAGVLDTSDVMLLIAASDGLSPVMTKRIPRAIKAAREAFLEALTLPYDSAEDVNEQMDVD